MNTKPKLDTDATVVLGIASTAMPFARSTEAQAERWLRALRSQGEVGAVLQTLDVSEKPLPAPSDRGHNERTPTGTANEHNTVERVTEQAIHIASQRDATTVATTDILLAVMHVYGADFDRVLDAHGTHRNELIERLAAK
jgi:hypothetical protein